MGKTRPGWKVLMELTRATGLDACHGIQWNRGDLKGSPPNPDPGVFLTPGISSLLRGHPWIPVEKLPWERFPFVLIRSFPGPQTEEVVHSSPIHRLMDGGLASPFAWIGLGRAPVRFGQLLWIRLRQVSHRWARKWWRSQTQTGSPWGDWEIWLATWTGITEAGQCPTTQTGPLWQEIGTLYGCPVGKPENRSWGHLMGKLK